MQLLRCLYADVLKTKRTAFMWLHLLAPLLYSAVCLLYFHARELEGAHIYELFMTPLAIALPFVVALVCGLTVSQEERAGHFQNIVGAPLPKLIPYFSKMTFLILLNGVSIFLAIGLLSLGFLLSNAELPLLPFLIGGAWLVATSVVLYFFYFFVSCLFGIGASALFGVAGLLMTALMGTGLGDAWWQYNPWAWGYGYPGMRGSSSLNKWNPLSYHFFNKKCVLGS
ncbi:lantibiotic protection ABC transporter permease [Shouchella clausii]|uniref:lantibiotic immunity ABC transporter MutG family permease subunit n=1 Tax=Shouchella clausii TaxID=79880 RepID=UPI000B960EBE|nr:lantibiotic immunity ABC transporter MutG family permease subunit [Shouchella clausii]AST98487.1 lantibiotic protection ABC transporter permease [Shouchella clausii]